MSDTPTPPEDPDEPQPVSSGDPLGEGAEPPREDPPTATQPMAAGPQPRRLTRSSSDKVIGGVAGGLGRYFDIDPIIFRIGVRGADVRRRRRRARLPRAWLLVPADPVAGEEPATAAARPRSSARSSSCSPRACCIGPGLFFLAPPLIGLALIGLVGVLLWRAAGGTEGGGARPRRSASACC